MLKGGGMMLVVLRLGGVVKDGREEGSWCGIVYVDDEFEEGEGNGEVGYEGDWVKRVIGERCWKGRVEEKSNR